MEDRQLADQPKEHSTQKNRQRSKSKSKKNRRPTKFFVFLDYGFLIVFIGFLCFVLLKLVGI